MSSQPFLVVGGSTRPNRRSIAVAGWVADVGRDETGETFEVIDLRDLGLGLADEGAIPAAGAPYAQASTQRWSQIVQAATGVVFVTPQYNWGYPAPLKNAIDHLYREWSGKPGLIVSYGGHGGDKCAAQLRVVLTGVRMRLAEAAPGLILSRARIEANDGAIEPAVDFAEQAASVRDGLKEVVALARQPGGDPKP